MRGVRLLRGAAALVGFLCACKPAAPVQEAAHRRFEQRAFTLTLPRGWRQAAQTPASFATAAKPGAGEFQFRSDDGGFLLVVVDPEAFSLRPDAHWKVEPLGDGLAIVEEGAPCRREDDPPDIAYECPAGNGRLDVQVSPVTLKGRYYALFFGNSRVETGVDLQPLREILRSFRAK